MRSFFLMLCVMLLSYTVTAQSVGDSVKTTTDANVVNIYPEYPGGIKAFYSFIESKFKRPRIGYATTLKIFASFVVEKDGSMSNFKILKDPGFGLGDETLRVLKLCTEKWKPGIQNGKVVRAAYNLPLTININN